MQGNVTIAQLIQALEQLRPFLQADGGDVELVRYEAGIVYVRMQGNCVSCPISSMTIKFGLEERLKQMFPEVNEVVTVE